MRKAQKKKSITQKLRKANAYIAAWRDGRFNPLHDCHDRFTYDFAEPTVTSLRVIEYTKNEFEKTRKELLKRYDTTDPRDDNFDHHFNLDNTVIYIPKQPKIDAKHIVNCLLKPGAGFSLDMRVEDVKRSLDNAKYYNRLFLAVNLNRPKEDILNEIARLLDIHLIKKKTRLSWIRKSKVYFQVWGEYVKIGGRPARQSFNIIAKKLKISTNTVKSRWRSAYKLITGKPYNPKAAKKQAKCEALELCAKCNNSAQCYKEIAGTLDWIPCAEYLKLTGKEYQREKPMTDKLFSIVHFGELPNTD